VQTQEALEPGGPGAGVGIHQQVHFRREAPHDRHYRLAFLILGDEAAEKLRVI